MNNFKYYEFCRLSSPLTDEIQQEMQALSKYVRINTHGASFLCKYNGLHDNPKKILSKYFDVFLYIDTKGILKLVFKYCATDLDPKSLKNYLIKDVIWFQCYDGAYLLSINLNNGEGFYSIKLSGLMLGLLPLYTEIKQQDYKFLDLITAINKNIVAGDNIETILDNIKLTPARLKYLQIMDFDYEVLI